MIISFLFFWQVRYFVYQISYDVFTQNELVEEKKTIDAILKTFEVINISELPKEYLDLNLINSTEYSKMFKNSKFYIIN